MEATLAIIATAISLASFLLSVHTHRVSTPRWHVDASEAVIVESAGVVTPALVVRVTNIGRAPGVIQGVTARTTDGTYAVDHRRSNEVSKGPAVPVTLAPTEYKTWMFSLREIQDALSRTDRVFAPVLMATVESGLKTIASKERVSLGGAPAPPVPFPRVPAILRHVIGWLALQIRRARRPEPQLVGASFVSAETAERRVWTVPVRNFGTGTARNLRLDMVREKDGVETRVEDVPPKVLRRLRPGKSHEFVYSIEDGTRPAEPDAR